MVTPARKGERHGCCRLLKKLNPGEGQVTEEFCIKSNNKFWVSLQEFIQVKMAQYSTSARTVTFVMSVLKTKSGLLRKILTIFFMVDWCCFQQVYHS